MIIVPGGRNQNTRREDDPFYSLPEEEIILAMYEDAKEKGIPFREYLANQIDRFNPDDFLRESWERFLRAVQVGEEKPFPTESGRYWNEKSRFEEWLWAQKQVALARLENVRKQKRSPEPSFPKLAKLMEEAEKHGADLTLNLEGVGEPPDKVVLEFYEEVLRKSIQTIDEFLSGQRKLPPSYSWGNIDDTGVGIEPEPMPEDIARKFGGGG